MASKPLVADNSTLSNFARSGHLDLLTTLIPQGVWVPAKVIEEIRKGVRKYPALQKLLDLQGTWIKEIPPEKEPSFERVAHLREQFRRIRKGADAWVIAGAENLKTSVLSDDQGILKTCRHLGIPVLTTPQLLKQALNQKIVSVRRMQKILVDLRDLARFAISWKDLKDTDDPTSTFP